MPTASAHGRAQVAESAAPVTPATTTSTTSAIGMLHWAINNERKFLASYPLVSADGEVAWVLRAELSAGQRQASALALSALGMALMTHGHALLYARGDAERW